jgi:hypothetical protein
MAAMKCVACAAPPQAPHTPKAGLRTRPVEEWAAHRRPDCRKPVGRLTVAGQRQLEKSRGGTDGRVPGTSYCGEISLSRGVP